MKESVTIAIDGPTGAGKSTIARELAQKLNFSLVDTGAIYRALALLSKERNIDWSDEETLATLAKDLPISFRFAEGKNHVFLGNIDVSQKIRTPEMSRGASQVSGLPKVRSALLDLQRQLGKQGKVVLEGRDIGTVVFPNAKVKFFLTASLEVRAKRRCQELQEAGQEVNLKETMREIEKRDLADSTRVVAPLRKAEDAIEINASEKSISEVIDEMMSFISF